ncbi:hypothetical protein D3C81_2196630 [compost metagenome]
MGITVKATTSDDSSATLRVMAKGRKISPITPLTKAMGANTPTVVMVDEVMAEAT